MIPSDQLLLSSQKFGEWYTHFLGNTLENPLQSFPSGTGAAVAAVAASANKRPGVWRLSLGTLSTNNAGIRSAFNFGMGQGVWVAEFSFKIFTALPTAGEAYSMLLGLLSSTAPDPTHGVYFLLSSASANLRAVATNTPNTTKTNTDTGVAISVGTWYDCIMTLTSTNCNYKVYSGGTLVANIDISTNLPSANQYLAACAYCEKTAGTTNREVDLDWMRFAWRLP